MALTIRKCFTAKNFPNYMYGITLFLSEHILYIVTLTLRIALENFQ